MLLIIKWKGNRLVKAKNKLVKSKIRGLAFTSLFPLNMMTINIIFVHTLFYVMVLQVEKYALC